MEDLLGLLERCPNRDGNEPVLCHHRRNLLVQSLLKPEIPVGEDSDKLSLFGDGNP